uniref:Uncharacterized protein n=1 Tax=Arundo donax TaxID=35708 RepID=A0A0A9H4S8_ARUDO
MGSSHGGSQSRHLCVFRPHCHLREEARIGRSGGGCEGLPAPGSVGFKPRSDASGEPEDGARVSRSSQMVAVVRRSARRRWSSQSRSASASRGGADAFASYW